VRLVLATSNRDKVREIRGLLAGLGVELAGLEAWPGVLTPDETGRTFEENARQKAIYYARATQECVVAEDSGLEIDALGGAPGVESARFGGVDSTYEEKFRLIYDALAKRAGQDDRRVTARFVCALALAQNGEVLFEARGTIEGEIARVPKGRGGFGYDPIFFYPPFGRTLGEASQDEKSAVSHRGQAFRRLRTFLESSALVPFPNT
jgi:XTP/dITP diphosphohydrolase